MQLKSLLRLMKPGERISVAGDHIELAEQFEQLMALDLVEFNNVDYHGKGAIAWVKALNPQKVYRFLSNSSISMNADSSKVNRRKVKKEEELKVVVRKGKGKVEAPLNWKPTLPEQAESRQRFRSIVRDALEKYVYRIFQEEYFVGEYQISYDDLTHLILMIKVNVEQTLPQPPVRKTSLRRTGSARKRAKVR